MKNSYSLQIFLIFFIIINIKNILCNNDIDDNYDDYFKEDLESYRLKGVIEPLHYNIYLTVLLSEFYEDNQFKYFGEVTIFLKTFKSNCNQIILHQRSLDIDKESIKLEKLNTNDKYTVTNIEYNNSTEKYGITFDKSMEPGIIYTLTIKKFRGVLKQNMIGFYRSSYKDNSGNIRWIATTQFNDKHTRQAFPCFDEPKFKATFNVTLNHEKELTAISNTKILKQNKDGVRRLETIFETTPKMSTYLVAFLISDYQEIFDREEDFGVAVRLNVIDYYEYALDIGIKLLNELNNYFDINYKELGIKKMHMAAIPDFAAGAMENWGLLLFKEKYFLYDAKTTPDLDLQRITTVIAHEQSHMWFGNFITLEWWNHLWINEGFARYFEYFIPNKIYPKWELENLFVFQQVHSSLLVDSLEGTGPMTIYESITKPYNPPAEYTTISYNKGASILRMFKYCMGEKHFKRGMQNLLLERKYQSATPDNVMTSFRREWIHSNISFFDFFTDWTEQPGYPIVHVSINKNKKSIDILQKRFIIDSDLNDPGLNPDLTYTIPITYTTNIETNFTIPNENEFKFVKPSQTDSVNLRVSIQPADQPIDWIIVNIQQVGFYRVNYDEENWLKIGEILNDTNVIHPINRANIIDDLFNFARIGLLKYSFIFKVLSYIERERDYLPLASFLNGILFLKTKLGQEYEFSNELNEFITLRFKKAFLDYNFNQGTSDKLLRIYGRSKLINWLCKLQNKDCINMSKQLITLEMKNNVTIHNKNIKNVVYCIALRGENEDEVFTYIQNMYRDIKNPTEKQSLLGVLGCVSSNITIQKQFNFILESDDVRLQDKMYAMNSLISENVNKTSTLLALVGENLEKVGKSLGGGENSVLGVISIITQYFTEIADIHLMNAFIDTRASRSYFSESGRKALDKFISKIQKNIDWKLMVKDDMEKVFKGSAIKLKYNLIYIFLIGILIYIVQ